MGYFNKQVTFYKSYNFLHPFYLVDIYLSRKTHLLSVRHYNQESESTQKIDQNSDRKLTRTQLEIATDTVANATNIFSLVTKNSGLVATLATRFLYDLDLN